MPWAEAASLAEAWWALVVAECRLRLMPAARVVRSREVGRAAPSAAVSEAERDAALRVAELVSCAARHHILRPNCLREALVLRAALRRRDLPAELVIGVRRPEGVFEAHAWVELGGVAVGEPLTPKAYSPLPGLG